MTFRPHRDLTILVLLCSAGVALWVISGAFKWTGYPAEHPWGPQIAAAIILALIAVFAIISRVARGGDVSASALILIIVCWTLARLTVTSLYPLGGDEAYHWQWARRLDLCYYDHPGMVAWLARLFVPPESRATAAIRLSSTLLGAGAAVATYYLARVTLNDKRLAAVGAILCLMMPIYACGAFLIPMTCVTFFWLLCAILTFRAIRSDRTIDWVLAGVALAACANCNFTAITLPTCVLAYLAASRWDRPQLRRPGPYLAAAIAAAGLLPAIVWNARHDWATFAFNLADRHEDYHFRPESPALYAASVCILAGPILAAGMIRFGGPIARNALRDQQPGRMFLAFIGFGPLIIFFGCSLLLKPRPHYAAPAFVPLMLLFLDGGRAACGREGRWRSLAVKSSVALSAAFFVCVLALAWTPPEWSHRFWQERSPATAAKWVAEFHGMPALARYLDSQGVDFSADSPTVLIAPSYAQASIIMHQSARAAYVYNANDERIPYGQQFRIWASIGGLPKGANALIIRAGVPQDASADLERWRKLFARVEHVVPDREKYPGIQYFTLYRADDYCGPERGK
jgi:hypothetical protein